MKRVLLIGNGINQVSDNGASWTALLDKLAGVPKNPHEAKVRKEKPFTLWFEELSSRTRKTNLKAKVATALGKDLRPNSIHSEIMGLTFQDVLTTNYDYNLEEATEEAWSLNLAAPENYYSLFRRRSFASRHIWHIHGELDNVGSIMLGHDQYSGYINKIRNFLTNGVPTESKTRDKRPYLSKYSGKKTDVKGDVENWVDVFLGSEVHIVGFGLDYTENHLWNLIAEKRRLRKKDPKSIGRAVFYRCSDHEQTTVDEARLSILNALGVKTVDYTRRSYADSYNQCIAGLQFWTADIQSWSCRVQGIMYTSLRRNRSIIFSPMQPSKRGFRKSSTADSQNP